MINFSWDLGSLHYVGVKLSNNLYQFQDLLPVEDKDGNVKGKVPQTSDTYKFVSEEHQDLVEVRLYYYKC